MFIYGYDSLILDVKVIYFRRYLLDYMILFLVLVGYLSVFWELRIYGRFVYLIMGDKYGIGMSSG
jgi:hypothetical protein